MLDSVALLDGMAEQMWLLLQRNLDPTAYLAGSVAELLDRFTHARSRFRARLPTLDHDDLSDRLSYFGRYDVTGLELLRTHALHLAGHRFQVRYVRGTFSRAHNTNKAAFDPW